MLDRTKAPVASDIARPAIPTIEEHSFNNIPVTVLNQGDQPVILIEIIIPVGRWQETQPGLSFYTYKMLTEGTATKSSEQIAEAFDYLGAHIEITPTLDHISIKLYTLSKFVNEALDLFVEILSESSFPSEEYEILKKIRLEQIRQQHARNNAYANLKFREMLFGVTHPYGLIITPEQTQKVELDSIREFGKRLLVNPKFFITGKVTFETLESIKSKLSLLAVYPDIDSSDIPAFVSPSTKIKREDSTQASIRAGFGCIDRKHPDIHKLKITNTLFGGYFGSRLMKNIREEKGLTYGIHSSFVHMDRASYWSISSEVLSEKADLAFEEILSELRILQNEPPQLTEFEMVKNYLKGKFLGSFDSPFNTLEIIKSMKLADISMNNMFDFLDELEQIKPADISEMAATYFKEDQITSLIVS